MRGLSQQDQACVLCALEDRGEIFYSPRERAGGTPHRRDRIGRE